MFCFNNCISPQSFAGVFLYGRIGQMKNMKFGRQNDFTSHSLQAIKIFMHHLFLILTIYIQIDRFTEETMPFIPRKSPMTYPSPKVPIQNRQRNNITSIFPDYFEKF